jgi:flagellar basal-body rod modification protein FlgD
MEVYSATSGTSSAAVQDIAPSTVTSDYETFLIMMTTQIQNQDPLEPMDANEFAVQLATFSSVEQQVLTNDLLTGLSNQMGMMGMAQMQGWIGNEVRIAAPVTITGSTPLILSPNPAAIADKAVLVVRDPDGVEVTRQEIPISTADYAWTPTGADGEPLPDGLYILSLESYSEDVLLGETEIEHYAVVQEVRASPSGTTLMFEGGIEVPSIYVTALREPTVPTSEPEV